MSFSKFSSSDRDAIARDYAGLYEVARTRCSDPSELEVVQKAFDFANEAHKNVRRRSGEPYILHPIAVAKIVASDIGLGYKSIAAALLHDVVEDTNYGAEDIKNLFGEKIASLVEGLTKIKVILDDRDRLGQRSTEDIQAENLKRILLTMNDDVRVVLIKLADRLHNCRTIEFMPEHKRDKILSETMFIFIPLAHRLGLYGVKSEMENIWLKYKEPNAYNEISRQVNLDLADKDREIDLFIQPIEAALKEHGFSFEIRKRVKTPYSIWHKMRTKNVSFEQIYDLYALRIIFTLPPDTRETERDQCYHIFSIITGMYRYKPDRVRDWVKHPKSNGYEALHCTVMSASGMWIEVQIRSKRMDDIAEKGIAAHWAYKQNGYIAENDSAMDEWLRKVKEILVSTDVNAMDLLDIIHNDLTAYDITVFTPKGEQRTVQKGYTALDFAYQIHTEIGNRAIAAKVNMKLTPLSYVLKSGDQVEIITTENGQPRMEWLQFLRSRHARNKVMDFFRQSWSSVAQEWRKTLFGKLSALGINMNEQIVRGVIGKVGVSNLDELLFRYSIGQIPYSTIEKAALESAANSNILAQANDKKLSKWAKGVYIINSPADGHRYKLASCCNPIAGDPVVGFLSPDGTIVVHKKTCDEAQSFASKHGNWIVSPEWANVEDQSFLVRISLTGIDRMGLISDVSSLISVLGLNIKKMELGGEQGIFSGYVDLYIPDKQSLDNLISRLKSISALQSVKRTDI